MRLVTLTGQSAEDHLHLWPCQIVLPVARAQAVGHFPDGVKRMSKPGLNGPRLAMTGAKLSDIVTQPPAGFGDTRFFRAAEGVQQEGAILNIVDRVVYQDIPDREGGVKSNNERLRPVTVTRKPSDVLQADLGSLA